MALECEWVSAYKYTFYGVKIKFMKISFFRLSIQCFNHKNVWTEKDLFGKRSNQNES